MKELSSDMKNLIENINKCCLKINEQKKLDCTFNKIEFLENKGFYYDYPSTKFNNMIQYDTTEFTDIH